jgi:hypothetical protein
VDAFLLQIAKAAPLATASHVLLLTRADATQETFTLYVLRWLRAVCPATTAVSAMPLPLYMTQVAGVTSALVVEGRDGLLSCTPVMEGVVAAELSAHWGDVRACAATVKAHSLAECWRRVAHIAMEVIAAAARLPENDSATITDNGVTPPQRLRSSGAVHAGTTAGAALMHEIPLVTEVQQHLQLCRRRELHACLSTVLLCGDAATVVEARYCMGLVLSLLLPDSLITWC